MKITFLRAKRIALVALLKAEKRRQQLRETEARFYSDEICPTTGAVDLGDSSALEVNSTPKVLSVGQGESHLAPNH